MKKNLSFFAFIHVLILLLSISTVSAQWTTTGPEGGFIKCMTRSGSTLYVVTNGVGRAIYSSNDNGNTWTYLSSPTLPTDIRAIAIIGDMMFLGTGSGLYRSDDAGASWVLKTNGFPDGGNWVNQLAVSDTTLFAAATSSKMLRSTDYGETWTIKNTGLTCNDIYALVATETAIFTGGGSNKKGVFRSTNNGDSWQQVVTGMAYWFQNGWVQGYYPNVQSLGFNGTDLYVGSNSFQGIWKSSDNGAHWVLTNPATRTNQWYNAISGDGNTIFAASLINGVFTSTDQGATWSAANNGIDIYHNARTIFLNEGTVFAGTKAGLYRTNDNGANWTKTCTGLNGHGTAFSGILTVGTDMFVGTTYGGVYRSSDAGNLWTAVNNGLPMNVNLSYNTAIYSNSTTLFGYDLMSTDHGDNWIPIVTPGDYVSGMGMPWTEHGTYLFASNSTNNPGVHRSMDNGQTWELVNNGFDPNTLSFGQVSSDGTNLYIETDMGYYYSSDNGNTWNLGVFPLDIFVGTRIASINSARILGIGGEWGQRGIFRTTDNGANWVQVNDFLVHKFIVSGNKIWASGTNLEVINGNEIEVPSIFLSQDEGQNWTKISGAISVSTYSIAAENDNIYVATYSPVFDVFRSSDNGNSWISISDGLNPNTEVSTLNIINNKLFAGTQGHSVWQRNLSDFVAPAQPDQIIGSETPCIGSSQTYSVTNVSGVTYNWQFPSGWIITAGNGTHSVTVTVGSTGGVIAVTPSNGFGTGPSQFLVVSPAQTVEATVSIVADQTSVCEGTSVLFTATPVNGGETPVYQWYVNGIESGENNPVFTYIPVNNDIVSLQLTSSIGCVTNNPVQSNTIQIEVTSPTDAVSVTINIDQSNICEGSLVTFTATPLNGGETPAYQWYVNGVASGTNSPVFGYVPTHNDVVYVVLTSSISCVINNPAQSDPITLQVTTAIEVTASISVDQNDLCEGSEMTFFASTSGGGTEPSYEWLINGTSAGVNAESFSFIPENGDAISLVFTSSEWCTAQNPVTSNTLVAIVNALPEVSWNYTDPTTVCIEDWGPITLTGGLPEGGTYTGDGVTGNIFNQAVAGVGNHIITYSYIDANNCSAQAQIEFIVDACLGITETANGLFVYPNPASDNFTIKLNNQNIVGVNLYNTMGIRVYSNPSVKTSGITVPVQNLQSGNYILKVTSDHETFVKTVMIK
ncbi:MAG: T9SS type A sorting domain-containing protein [Bacteroidales bacterium]|nr:T9SS type A sorting domain-containing protein [Bacteroidales bacterium]